MQSPVLDFELGHSGSEVFNSLPMRGTRLVATMPCIQLLLIFNFPHMYKCIPRTSKSELQPVHMFNARVSGIAINSLQKDQLVIDSTRNYVHNAML